MRKIAIPKLLGLFLIGAAIVGAMVQMRGTVTLGGCLLIALAFFSALFLFFSKQPLNLLLILASSAIGYFAMETILYFALRKGFEKLNPLQQTYYSANSVSVDTLAGYRWKKNALIRTVRYLHGRLIYDNRFQTNNMGYVAPFPFVSEKPPGVYRIIWLGDSYSEGIFLKKSYPNLLQGMFAAEGKRVEIYNFSMDAGGIMNWYRQFYDEIIHMQFDAIVIASFMDNLDRDLALVHTLPDGFYFRRTPSPIGARFSYAYLDSLMHISPPSKKVADVVDEQKEYHSRYREIPFKMYFYKYLNDLFEARFEPNGKEKRSPAVVEAGSGLIPGLEEAEKRHGTEKIKQLASILDTCRKMHKDILIASIPSLPDLLKLLRSHYKVRISHQLELQHIARLFGAGYFDGYEVFKKLDEKKITHEAWLPYDGHWGQKGSDIYAMQLHDYLNSPGSPFHFGPGKY